MDEPTTNSEKPPASLNGKSNARRAPSASTALARAVEGQSIGASLKRALARTGAAPWALVRFTSSDSHEADSAQQQGEAALRNHPHHVVAHVEGADFAFVPYFDALSLFESGRRRKPAASGHPVILSLPIYDIDDIPTQVALMDFAAQVEGETGIIDVRDVAFRYLTRQIKERIDYRNFLHPALAILERYDADNDTNMLETLRIYLDNDRNAQRCANIMFLHRNSLQYRIRRIQEIARIDLNDPNVRTHLRLSFLLAR